jgi:hypothetical protein
MTQALDDASQRLGRYLLLQFVVNASYGLLFGLGAYVIGIPHPLLWGFSGVCCVLSRTLVHPSLPYFPWLWPWLCSPAGTKWV